MEEIVHNAKIKPSARARCFIPNANFDAAKIPFPILAISYSILGFSSQTQI